MIVVTFHTTADAFAFEAAASACRAGKLGTIPRALSAGCGLAWLEPEGSRSDLERFLAAEALAFEGVHEL